MKYDIVDGKTVGEIRYGTGGVLSLYLRYIFDESGSVVGISLWYAGDGQWTDYYFVKNLQGDVIEVYDTSNTLAASYTYDAWGNILTKSGDLADLNPFRYRTYYFDNETWFYYLQSRYYNPGLGRFLNADAFASTGQGLLGNNMFAYCLNNPVNYADYDGFRVAVLIGLAQTNFQLFEEASGNPKDSPPEHPDFTPPKKGNKKVKNPNGKGWGWVDNKGNVWVWNPGMHGGEGWVIQEPDGGHSHAYPGGGVRHHFESVPNSVSITVFPANQLVQHVMTSTGNTVLAGGLFMVCYIALEMISGFERST